MRSLVVVLVLIFTSGTARAESAAWLEDYIEKNPSRRLTRTTPDVTPKTAKVEKEKPTKAGKTKAKAAAKKAKAKRSKAKRARRR